MELFRVSESPSELATDCTNAKALTHEKSLSSTLNLIPAGPTAEQLRRQAEALLESAIAIAATRVAHAPTKEERIEAWGELACLHSQRSTETVERMERDRGLR